MENVIYKITGPTGKLYIGSASNFEVRKRRHLRALRAGRHHSRYLQRAWNKYGEAAFIFSVVLVCERSNLFFYEQLLLDGLAPAYNVSPSATGTRGLRWTEDQKAKIRGRINTKETRARISHGMLANTTPEERQKIARTARAAWTEESKKRQVQNLTGRKDSPETREKKIAKLRGRPVSKTTREKLSVQRGWKHSDEAKAKMRGRIRSQEHRDRLSESLKGRSGPCLGKPKSQETRQKISAALKGRRLSEETRRKMSLARKGKLPTFLWQATHCIVTKS